MRRNKKEKGLPTLDKQFRKHVDFDVRLNRFWAAFSPRLSALMRKYKIIYEKYTFKNHTLTIVFAKS